MSFGLAAFTLFHVILSLAGIVAGFVVVYGLFTSRRLIGWTAIFLSTTLLTSITGFLFPFHKFLPSHAIGILSVIALVIAIYAYYSRRLARGWRRTYAITAVTALYFNVFVLIAQLFSKVPALRNLAPTPSAPAFKAAQSVALVAFLVLGIFATKRFLTKQALAA